MNRLSSLLGGLAIIAIAVVFIVNFQPGGGQNQFKKGPDCAADVLGKCVRASHFWASYRLLAPRGSDMDEAQKRKLKEMTLDGLVERELLLGEAKRLGIGVSDEDLSKELFAGRLRASVPAKAPPQLNGLVNYREAFLDRKTKKFSADVYKRTVTELTYLSETDFRDYQRAELIAARMRDLVKERVRVSEGEAFDQFAREKMDVTVRFVKLEPAYFAQTVVDTSEAAVKAWADKHQEDVAKAFEAHKKDYEGGCRVSRHILVRVSEKASEEDKKKAREKIEAAQKRIKDGEKFADVAKEISQDPVSGKQGGSLECVVKGQMVKPFEDALFALEEGKLSNVVETPFGLHLIQVDKILSGEDAVKAGQASTARPLYLQAEAQRLADEGAKEILAAMKGGKKMDEALKDYLAKIKPAAPEKKDEEKKDGDHADKKDEEKKDGDKKDGDHADKKDAPAEDEDEGGPQPPTVETSLPFGPTEQPFTGVADGEDASGAAFSLNTPDQVAERPVRLASGGLAILQLVERKAPGEEEWKKDRDFYMGALRSQKQREALTLYLKRLRTTYQQEIKLNKEFTKDFAPEAAPAGSGLPPGPAPMPPPAPAPMDEP
ncbi:MAG: peptidylprolyl isomerase [Myxococcales bacterium]|nr:peptidylprolyl isomerase [Myxococcales bacterium]